ncbi:histidine phosphatase family protein [Glycomyces sp. L485]|uniref:histidine phosphatase family protein n=1 Tax=Glycomyces sp. L485 TaxID=2909235 RepID=UPI001F4A36F9|nr:histidine phosphatase family protein [Glycomyces sp. L485]MCH7233092.1 histidine phosphatase family protein [Glycomyces sp. L485]
MPMLEIRRHSKRDGAEAVHLSQKGVELARWAGTLMGPFEIVAASVAPRTRETAIAMGFAVNLELPTLKNVNEFMTESQMAAHEVGAPFTRLARLVNHHGAVHDYASAMAVQWQQLMASLGPGDAALVIGHGGHLECGLITLFPDADHDSWGPLFDYMEGARVHYDSAAERFHDVELVRM